MQIECNEGTIDVRLNWQEWQRVDRGESIGDRYDGINKIVLQRKESSDANNGEQGHAELSRETMDITAYIPLKALQDARISGYEYSTKKGNLIITPPFKTGQERTIRIAFPGSAQKIDIPSFYE